MNLPAPNRRALLRGAGALVAGATAAALAPSLATAAPRTGGWPRPDRDPFDLAATPSALIDNAPLHDATVLQSFAFDDTHRRIYALQLMAGGEQLPGEAAPVSGALRAANGDMALTELDLAGNETGHMYLTGFGHGVQMGVEPTWRGATMWTEVASDNEGTDSGWGTRLARFAFRDGTVLATGSPLIRQYEPVADADRTTVNVDIAHRLVTVRHRVDGTAFRYAVFDLDGFGHRPPRYDVAQPTLGTFQGYTSFGPWLYLLSGDHYGATGSTAPVGDTYITTVDLRSGEVVAQRLMDAFADLSYREPEGMAIRLADPRRPETARLTFGFACGETGDRRATIVALGGH